MKPAIKASMLGFSFKKGGALLSQSNVSETVIVDESTEVKQMIAGSTKKLVVENQVDEKERLSKFFSTDANASVTKENYPDESSEEESSWTIKRPDKPLMH